LTRTQLQGHLRQVLATRPERLITDLTQVLFMGSTALSVLLSLRHAAAQQSMTLQLKGTQ
jgi:anti-anti-sigma factor